MKHVKKILSITSALLCAVGLLGTQFPEVNAAENVYGEFTYVLYDSNNDGKNDSVEITDCDEFVTRADIPDEIEGMPVTRIKDFVFAFCFGLTEINIPDSVIFIDDAAFNICVSLENINVSENSNNFCSLDGVLFNKEKTNLIKYPSAKKTERYTISNGVIKISENAFEDCNNLIELTIPESVKYMGNTGEWAISGSEKLESINVSENNADFCSVDGVLFNKDCTTLIKYPIGKTETEYTVKESVTKIGGGAFAGCYILESIILPDKINYIGEFGFNNCRGLKTIKLPDKLTSLGKYAFWNCTSLNGIVIPEGVTNIGENTFFCCESLKSITIKNPKCEIYGYNLLYNYNNTICDKYDEVNEEYIYTGIIYGHENSTAQAYAEKCNIKFAVIGTEYNGVKGDANGDGKLRASDAAFIAKTLAEASVKGEKVTAENYPNADFNGDGKVTAADAAAIAKYLAEQSIKK